MLTQRQQIILFQIIRHFIATGDPVSSKAVLQSGVLNVSSATIRNVMSELENLGYLEQPHTSAGRVPTPIAFRDFVNQLDIQPTSLLDVQSHIAPVLDTPQAYGLTETARRVSSLLSQLSELTSLVSTPTGQSVRLCDIHLSVLSNHRILVMLITDDERVHHRVVQMTELIEPSQLKRMENYLASLAVGLTLEQVRHRVRDEIERLRLEYDNLMRTALMIGAQALEVATPTLHIEGALKFFDHVEFSDDTSRLKEILNLLDDHDQMLHLLDRLCDTHGQPTTLIGPELQFDGARDMSLIICGYDRDGEPLGVVGLIGPVRMNYARIIPLVAQTARMLSDALKDPSSS